MSQVEWTPTARNDLEEIAFYLGVTQHVPTVADRIVDEIVAKCAQYARQPQMGTRHPDLSKHFRVFSHQRYVVIYRPLDDGIEILRVVHGSRDYPAMFGLP